jgi:alpha-tubulin suppressor-like RCC1 family protein
LSNATFFGGNTPVAISSGNQHSGVIDSAGNIWMCGLNASGQCGNGTFANVTTWYNVTSGQSLGHTASLLSCGGDIPTNGHTMAILSTGTVLGWGCDLSSQLGDGGSTNQSTPQTITISGGPTTPLASIYAGGDQTIIIDSGAKPWMVGLNSSGQCGTGSGTGTITAWTHPAAIGNTANLVSTTAENVMCHNTS